MEKMSDEQKVNRPTVPFFPFQPYEFPSPPYFVGCYCVGTCKCKYDSHENVSADGVFKPFATESKVGPPRVCVWEHITKEDYKKLELANFEMRTVFFLFEKRFPMPPNAKGKDIMLQLLYEALRYSRINMMSAKKASALVSMYYNTHQFFLSSLWRTPDETYYYFKETILLHTVQRPPKSTEILQPDESRGALLHFVNVYLRHLALVAVACLPTYRLQMIWPTRPLTRQVQLRTLALSHWTRAHQGCECRRSSARTT